MVDSLVSDFGSVAGFDFELDGGGGGGDDGDGVCSIASRGCGFPELAVVREEEPSTGRLTSGSYLDSPPSISA